MTNRIEPPMTRAAGEIMPETILAPEQAPLPIEPFWPWAIKWAAKGLLQVALMLAALYISIMVVAIIAPFLIKAVAIAVAGVIAFFGWAGAALTAPIAVRVVK